MPSINISACSTTNVLKPVETKKEAVALLTPCRSVSSVTESSFALDSGRKLVRWREGCPTIFVKKWCDYSSKYGLAFMLSNSLVGVVFNDETRVLTHPCGEQFTYQTKVKYSDGKWRNHNSVYSMELYPEDISSKVSLLKKFKDYLQESDKGISKLQSQADIDFDDVLVKSWKKGKWGILFNLSSGLVQANFTDDSEIFINT